MDKLKNAYEKVITFFKFLWRKRRKIEYYMGQFVIYALLITISYVFLFPFIKMISLTFMSQADLIDPEIDYLPKSPTLDNFRAAFVVLDGLKSFWNSFWVSGVYAVGQTLVSALTGFAFARYNFKFKNLLFLLVLISFILPVPVILIPRIMMFSNLQSIIVESSPDFRLFGTVIPQLIMSVLGQGVNSAILILIFYNFFRMIPKVLYEAARIDGAGALAQFWHITIKMSASTIIVVFLFSFVWNWNETYITGIFNGTLESLPHKLAAFDSEFRAASQGNSSATGGTNLVTEAHRMAGTLVSMIPLFVIYFLAQKRFVEGIENTGITGE